MFTVERSASTTVIKFREPMTCISSAVYGGGIKIIITIINKTLGKNEVIECTKMREYCRSVAKRHSCEPQRSTVLLTSVPQMYGAWSHNDRCFMTAGLGNATPLEPLHVWDEKENTHKYNPGTINCISVLDDSLTEEALIEAYGIARLSIGSFISDFSKLRNTCDTYVGTPTDCVAVLCPLSKDPLHFAGLGTRIGLHITTSIKQALTSALSHKYPAIYSLGKNQA